MNELSKLAFRKVLHSFIGALDSTWTASRVCNCLVECEFILIRYDTGHKFIKPLLSRQISTYLLHICVSSGFGFDGFFSESAAAGVHGASMLCYYHVGWNRRELLIRIYLCFDESSGTALQTCNSSRTTNHTVFYPRVCIFFFDYAYSHLWVSGQNATMFPRCLSLYVTDC